MGLKPHDIVKFDPFVLPNTAPQWAKQTLACAPYAVVTRAQAPSGCALVGVRGQLRQQRLSFLMPLTAVELTISPESLAQQTVSPHLTQSAPCFQNLAQFRSLPSVQGLCWGPVGSIGFELATGSKTTTVRSDLDVIVRMLTEPTLALLKRLRKETAELAIDVLLEGKCGAVCLAEYVQSPQRTLIRTPHGPELGIFVA